MHLLPTQPRPCGMLAGTVQNHATRLPEAGSRQHVNDMDHRGIRYTIRMRIERGEWSIGIHRPDGTVAEKVVACARASAESTARSMIDAWLKAHPEQCPTP